MMNGSMDSESIQKLYDDKVKRLAELDKYNDGKCRRITKKELMAFVEWMFEKFDNGDCSHFSAQMLSNLYMQETGKYVSNATIRNNKNVWTKNMNGQLVKIA